MVVDVDAMSFFWRVGRTQESLGAYGGQGLPKCPPWELHNVFRFYIN